MATSTGSPSLDNGEFDEAVDSDASLTNVAQ